MSGLIRIEHGSDMRNNPELWQGQLYESLLLMSNKFRDQQATIDKILDADKIVRLPFLQEFPVAAGQIYTGEEGGEVGDIMMRGANEAPVGTLECDGTAISRTTYDDLFDKIGTTFGAGDGSTTFDLPDFRGRVPLGVGTGSGLTARALADVLGVETHPLTSGELAAHTHTGPDHNHTIAHTHDMAHGHAVGLYTGTAGPVATHIQNNNNGTFVANDLTSQPTPTDTGAASTSVSGNAGTGATGSTGSGTAHQNMQPSLAVRFYIRFRLGPTDTIQTLPVSWGRFNAQWRLDTLKSFPGTGVDNLHNVIVAGDRPEAVVRITAASGVESGNMTENKIVGVIEVPYNFRGFRADAFKIRTRVESTGITGGDSCTVTLKVSDPISAGSFLSSTYARTISESSNAISDGAYVDAKLQASDLGSDWKPGYLFRFELLFSHPKTFTSCQLDVGKMELNWR